MRCVYKLCALGNAYEMIDFTEASSARWREHLRTRGCRTASTSLLRLLPHRAHTTKALVLGSARTRRSQQLVLRSVPDMMPRFVDAGLCLAAVGLLVLLQPAQSIHDNDQVDAIAHYDLTRVLQVPFPKGVTVVTGYNRLPAYHFSSGATVIGDIHDLIPSPFPQHFSLLATLQPNDPRGGVVFAITDRQQKKVLLGLKLAPEEFGGGWQSIILLFSHPDADETEEAAIFRVKALTGQWWQIAISIEGTTATLFLNCKFAGKTRFKRPIGDLRFPLDATILLGHAGRTDPTFFLGNIQEMVIHANPKAAKHHCDEDEDYYDEQGSGEEGSGHVPERRPATYSGTVPPDVQPLQPPLVETIDGYSPTNHGNVNHLGIKGDKGDPGDPGRYGAKGEKGDVGVSGGSGFGSHGSMGPQGPKGDNGDPGLKGEQGEKGSSGAKGEVVYSTGGGSGKHAKGDKGDPGLKGSAGFGYPGSKGAKGDPGPPGISGAIGPPGPATILHRTEGSSTQIVQGPTGQPGPAGPPGPRGLDGIHGDPGEDGLPGEKGQPGMPGIPGIMGRKGDKVGVIEVWDFKTRLKYRFCFFSSSNRSTLLTACPIDVLLRSCDMKKKYSSPSCYAESRLTRSSWFIEPSSPLSGSELYNVLNIIIRQDRAAGCTSSNVYQKV
uniref:Thrombospondin-like N-terminal domain-containing protein n=1 Tax=Eptatretus burgeri TaxID=7764 RepID=A0A8C4WWE5_EPTBU